MVSVNYYIYVDYSDFMIPQDNNYYISPGNTSICINVQAVPDDIVEINETFSLRLNSSDYAPGTATVTIIDDDGKERESVHNEEAPL